MELVKAALEGFTGLVQFQHESEGYEDALKLVASGSSILEKRRPTLIARPACAGDVQLAVRAASVGAEHGVLGSVPLAVRGGRCSHGHSELPVADGSLQLDMRDIAGITIDSDSRLITFGAGAIMGDIQAEASKHGLAAPIGWTSTPGIGLVLAGGVGHITRLHGLALDNVVEITVVVADGSLRRLTAPQSSDSDLSSDAELWWAMLGAGPAFGVVTQVVMRAHNIGDVLFGRLLHTLGSRADAIRHLTDCEHKLRSLPRDQHVDLILGYHVGVPKLGLFPCSLHGKPFDEAVSAILNDENGDVKRIKYSEINMDMPFDCTQTKEPPTGDLHMHIVGGFVNELGSAGVEVLIDSLDAMPCKFNQIVLHHAGGAIRDVAATATSFPCRDMEFGFVLAGVWFGDSDEAKHSQRQWIDSTLTSLSPFISGLYCVSIDSQRQNVDEEVKQTFGCNLARLQQLKQQLDPTNLFRGTFPLRPGA